MGKRLVLFVMVVSALITASPAIAWAAGTVTATGTGQVRVVPQDRHSNASIVAAYDAARKNAIAGALAAAHEYAVAYASAGGLTLGSVLSITDAPNGGFSYGPGPDFGPFGPEQFCGTIRESRVKVVKGKNGAVTRRVVAGKKVHRCIVPPFAFTTLTVTYSAN